MHSVQSILGCNFLVRRMINGKRFLYRLKVISEAVTEENFLAEVIMDRGQF